MQTDIVTRQLKKRGHEPIVSAFYGLRGAILNNGGIPVLPGSAEQWGNDIVLAHYDFHRPDVAFMLMDAWVLEDKVLDALPATVWAPVDHTPIPAGVANKLFHTRWPLAMSRHGERAMRQVGLDPFYCPHMVETDVYKPVDREQSRALYALGNAEYVVCSVAANKGFPSRKNIDKLLHAWAKFIETHTESVLYLHTNPYPVAGGLDIPTVCEFYGLKTHLGTIEPGQNLAAYDVVLPDVYRMMRGDVGSLAMNHLYNMADAFILPSAGEGFGIPTIEAQSAGCPVIVTDYTALSELGEAGYLIPIDPIDDVEFTLQSSHQCNPKVSEIIKGLEWGYEHRRDNTLRARAREFAMGYDADSIMERYMLPQFATMAQGNADYMQFQQYRKERAG